MVNKNLVLGVAAALCSVPALAQQDPATVTIQTQTLAGNVYRLIGEGGNDVKYVINTHSHGDHTGGNEPLGKAGAVIIAHDNVLTRLSTEQFMAAFNQKVPPAPAAARPVVTFPTRATFYLNGDVVQVVHIANAHTDGD